MSAFLVTYKPLAISLRGRAAANKYALPPFIDASCRREPDFESPYPSISAICRVKQFAPRLDPGDEILYLTVKSNFSEQVGGHYRAVAHLKVKEKFHSHADAADWYRNQGCSVPNNCLVPGNPPVPFARTGAALGRKTSACSTAASLRAWDRMYHDRAKKVSTFLACDALWMELYRPPRLFAEDLIKVFGRVPGTRTPPEISIGEIHALLAETRKRGV
jgi:hypothetical protein